QMLGSDQLPLRTLTMVGLAPKLGIRRYGVTMYGVVTGDTPPEGGVGVLETVTVSVADVVLLPAASRALAAKVCVPLARVVVFQLTENGAEVSSAPNTAPST